MTGSIGTLNVPGRFCGPPGAGNGGYVSGLLAEHIGAGAEVTLRRPTPLDRPLALCSHATPQGTRWTLADGQDVLAEAAAATRPELDLPVLPDLDEALAAGEPEPDAPHPFPGCFVCGPARPPGDGLALRPRPFGAGDVMAAPWAPDASLADASGLVAPRFVWAALDCPGGLAAMAGQAVPMVLGRITGATTGPVRAGERYLVVGWRIAREGRKHTTGTALVSADGRVCGTTRQLWIELAKGAG